MRFPHIKISSFWFSILFAPFAYNFKKMIQTSNTRFLPRLLTLWVLLLAAVTAEEQDKNYDSAAASPPSFLRRALQQTCNKNKVCPTIEPTPGGSCCYTGKTSCKYNYRYLWDSTCENISCIPVSTCKCSPNPANRKESAWNCALKRRALGAIACAVTDATPSAAKNLAPSVGMLCTPSP